MDRGPAKVFSAASQRSSETLYDDCSVEEVWYGEAGQAEKEKLAAPRVVEEKPSKAGRGKSVGKGNAKKAKNKDGGKKERIRKATNVKVKKKGANKCGSGVFSNSKLNTRERKGGNVARGSRGNCWVF